MDWKNISIKKYLKIEELLQDPLTLDDEKMILIANVIYDQDVTELNLPEYAQKINALKFINTPPEKEKLSSNYTVNGVKYKTNANLEVIQANQFIDFQNYAKKKDIIGCISCFFIPEGHKYNDGYDMLKVKEDIGELPITVANSLAFFFIKQYAILLILSSRYSLQQMKEMGLKEEKLKEMADSLTTLGMSNLVSSLLSSFTAH